MGKTYIDTVKYLVHGFVEISGMVEKPDVVGAIFGQTEGLLGDELDLRELQKNGRIGRIEVDLQVKGGKSIGKILLPSSLDMVETSILAAALETVDRVGPCEANIKVEKIEDTRNMKRKSIIDRAKSLLKSLLTTEIPESKEISELVRQEVKTAEINEYGSEKLPCGPNITTYDSLIIVEGRADVLNLLKNDINNVIAVGGINVPKTIAALCKEKEVTVFLDGDRGGDLIFRGLMEVAELDYVARAPAGKEVEELTRKEIIKCLRNKVPVEQEGGPVKRESHENRERQHERPERQFERQSGQFERQPIQKEIPQVKEQPAQAQVPKVLLDGLNELENTLRARFYDDKLNLKAEIPVRELLKTLAESEAPYAIAFDGIITQRLVDITESKGTKILAGVKASNIFRKPENMTIVTKPA